VKMLAFATYDTLNGETAQRLLNFCSLVKSLDNHCDKLGTHGAPVDLCVALSDVLE